MCINDTKLNKPVVYVNNAYDYFNISGSLSASNIKFSGVNSYSVSSNSGEDISVFPIQMCQVNTEPLPGDSPFNLNKIVNNVTNLFSYKC